MQLRELLIPGEDWRLVAEGFQFTEGPAVNDKGEVFFTDVPANKIYKIGLDGKTSLFVSDTQRAVGQAIGPDGRLYAAAEGADKILAYGPDGKPKTVADGIHGNDLVVGHKGDIYVTNPGPEGTRQSKVWHISPGGEKKIVDTGLRLANGIALSPDQSLLYVADTRTRWIYSYRIGSDGRLLNKQRYFHLHEPDTWEESGADGMRVDQDGRLWVATHMGLQVCDQAGRVMCIIPTPNGKVAHLCFGGEDFQTLFALCEDRVYKRKVKVKGVLPFQAPIKPAPPRL